KRAPEPSSNGSSLAAALVHICLSTSGHSANGRCSLGFGPGIDLLLLLIFVPPPRAVEFRLPQLPNEISVRPTGATGIGPGINPGRGFKLPMAEKLTERFVTAGI